VWCEENDKRAVLYTALVLKWRQGCLLLYLQIISSSLLNSPFSSSLFSLLLSSSLFSLLSSSLFSHLLFSLLPSSLPSSPSLLPSSLLFSLLLFSTSTEVFVLFMILSFSSPHDSLSLSLHSSPSPSLSELEPYYGPSLQSPMYSLLTPFTHSSLLLHLLSSPLILSHLPSSRPLSFPLFSFPLFSFPLICSCQ
jgi:hypothetical protein